MDSLASLALATESPKEELLQRPPYRRDEYIISRKMVKIILGVSFYQIAIVYAIVFGGENFYPEPDPKWRFERAAVNTFVYPGRRYDWDSSPLYEDKLSLYGPSRHLTNVFNVFVVLQIFNMLNARKINDEKNIFAGIFENKMYLIIWVIIAGGQVIIVQLTGRVFKCAIGGLPWEHWVIAIVLGVIELFYVALIKFIPDSFCPQLGKKQKNPFANEDHNVLSLRKKRTQSFSLRNAPAVNKEGSGR